jgi:hypothetical protein
MEAESFPDFGPRLNPGGFVRSGVCGKILVHAIYVHEFAGPASTA